MARRRRRRLLRSFGASLIAMFHPRFGHAQPGASERAIKVGQSAAFNGAAAPLGMEVKQGMEAHFRAINARGGIGGRPIQLVSLDDGNEPARTSANTARLIEAENVLALMGYAGTPSSNAAIPVFTAAKVPFIGPLTGADSLRSPFNRYIFNVRASHLDEGVAVVKHLATFGSDRIALFCQDDAHGLLMRASIERALDAQKLRAMVVTTAGRIRDVGSAARLIAGSGARSVAIGSSRELGMELVGQVRALGAHPVFSSMGFVEATSPSDLTSETAKGVGIVQVMPFPMAGATAIGREYQQAMKEAGYSHLGYGSIEGYVAARVFTLGLRRAGANPSRERLISALETRHDVGDFVVEFSPTNHNGSRFTELTVIGANRTLVR